MKKLLLCCLLVSFCAEVRASLVNDTISGYATYSINSIGNRFDEDTAIVSNDEIEFHNSSDYLPITVDFTDYTITVDFTSLWDSTNEHVFWEFTFSDLDYGLPITNLTVLQNTFDTSPTYSWSHDSITINIPGGSANRIHPFETHLFTLAVPEPTTLLLLGLGGLMLRRKRK